MDSPGDFAESPLDQEDVVYPCKGCGEVGKAQEIVLYTHEQTAPNELQILEEGKAFELGKLP